jgi:mannose-6-phosphate isomerase-like protein (cupin superfamily)
MMQLSACPCCSASTLADSDEAVQHSASSCRRFDALTHHLLAGAAPVGTTTLATAASGKQIWGETLPYEPVRLFHTVGDEAPALTEAVDVHLIETAPGAPESIRGVPWFMQKLLSHESFQTPWRFVHTGLIAPGAGIGEHIHGNCEEIFFAVGGGATHFVHNGRKAEVAGTACVPCRTGESHGIMNVSDEAVRWFNVNVCMPNQTYDSTELQDRIGAMELESEARLPVGRFERSLLHPLPGAWVESHGGATGVVLCREVWGQRDFRTSLNFVRHFELAPGSSLGGYRRHLVEECFLIISGGGGGEITIDGEIMAVGEGDVVFAGLGEARRLACRSDATAALELIAVGVAMNVGREQHASGFTNFYRFTPKNHSVSLRQARFKKPCGKLNTRSAFFPAGIDDHSDATAV